MHNALCKCGNCPKASSTLSSFYALLQPLGNLVKRHYHPEEATVPKKNEWLEREILAKETEGNRGKQRETKQQESNCFGFMSALFSSATPNQTRRCNRVTLQRSTTMRLPWHKRGRHDRQKPAQFGLLVPGFGRVGMGWDVTYTLTCT